VDGLFIQQLTNEPVFYFSVVITVVVSVVLHELGHVFAALRQGDETPRAYGHVTWDPIVHMGTTSLIFLFLVGIAWGQTPVDPSRFRSRRGRAIVSWSGPAVNLILAGVGLVLAGIAVRLGSAEVVRDFLWIFGTWNVVLFLFNLVPIPPLDGSTILADWSPAYASFSRNPTAQPIFMAAFFVLFLLGGRYLFDAATGVGKIVVGWIAG
jgi:Zn-dependent protease